MEQPLLTLLAVGAVNLLMFPVLTYVVKRWLGKHLDEFDQKRDMARNEAESAREESRMWRQAMENGMKSLLRAELLHEHDKWDRKGYCPFESKQYLDRLHDAYKGVGGNSIGDKLYEETISLPNHPQEG